MGTWWDPEEQARAERVGIVETDRLPDRLQACLDLGRRIIWLAVGLSPEQRRCAIAYEIGQFRQGPTPDDPFLARAHQRAAEEWAALTLIPTGMFVEAWEGCLDLAGMAARCKVDVPTFRTRIRAASNADQDAAMEAIGRTRLSAY